MRSSFEKFDLSNSLGLITGAGGLLGFQHAAALLESGAMVVLTDVSQDALLRNKRQLSEQFDESKIIVKLMDVTNIESIRSCAQSLESQNLKVNILINNAAVDPKVKDGGNLVESSRLENFSLDQWNFQIAVGLTGAFLCSQVFGSSMARRRSGGVILNIASDLSVIAPDQRLYRKEGLSEDVQPVKPVTYSVIKAGLVGLTRYLATYWADSGVRANALSPGGVFNEQGEDFVMKLSSLIPLGRMARQDEYRGAVQFLCSDASSYMNGQNIVIDGGRSVL